MARAHEFPDEGDLVVATVTNVKNFGAFVGLDEFGGKEGFIHVTEVAPGWIKYIRDYVREGQKVVCKVLKVDRTKGHVDLSLKSVNEHQRREKIQEWKNEQKADKLLGMVGERLGKPLEALYEEFGFKLVETFGSLYAAMEAASGDADALKDEGFEGAWTEPFLAVARENIVPPSVKIDGYLELTCPTPKGAVTLREALSKAQKEDGVSVKVQYVGAPRYRLVVRAPDYKTAEEAMQKAAQVVLKYLQANGGQGTFQRKVA